MLKRAFLVSTLVALAVSGSTAVSLGATWHGGGFGFGAAPESVVPASADMYVGLNSGGAQGAALAQLWAAYQAHRGTATALAYLRAAIGQRSLLQTGRLLSALGAHAGVAIWAPATNGPTAQPRVAFVAQLKVSTFLSGTGPLAGLASFAPIARYMGTTVYRVVFKGGGTAYGEIVAGDGVLTTDLGTAERIVDAATFHAPALATSAGFVTATAQLPNPRALTFYVTLHFFRRVQQAVRISGAPPVQAPMLAGALQQPYATAVVAAPDGLSIVSSVQQVPAGLLHLTPNAGAGVVGSNAILYLSADDLAATLATPGVLPANVLTQFQVQTGLAVQRDILPLISHEVVVDVNDEVSDVLLAASRASAASAQTVPALRGSIELATWVDEPGTAEHALARIAAALSRSTQQQGQTPGGAPVVKTMLPDGSTAYRITALPGLSYTVRGHWLLLSTSLRADLSAARVPLAADPGYQAALAHVAGPGPLVSVEYVDDTRLLAVVDAWLAFVQAQPNAGIAPGTLSTWRQHLEPLIAPLRSIMTVARQVGARGAQTQTFITVKP